MVQLFWKIAWQFLVKLSIYLPCNLAITLLGIYSREMKTFCSHKNLLPNVHSSFICNTPKLEDGQISLSFNRWMIKQVALNLYNKMPFSNTKKWAADNSQWLRWQNYSDGCQGLGVAEGVTVKKRTWRSFFVVMEQLCILVVAAASQIYPCDKMS